MRRLLELLGLLAALVGCGAPSSSSKPSNAVNVVAGGPTAGPSGSLPDGPAASGPWVGVAAASDAFFPGWQDTFVAVWVDVPKEGEHGRTPAAVSLVIDTSGSMGGDKIRHAREAATKLVADLRDGDIVSVVTFSDRAEERVSPTKLDAMSRQRINSILSELRAEGGTNLFEGVRTGGMAVMSAPATHPVRRVVLVSDGIATVGMTNPAELGNLGEKAGDRGVQLTAIGVGLDYDERTLNQLAIRSSGRLYHLTETRALPEIIAAEMNLLKATRATNARVSIVPAPGVQLVGVDGARGVFTSGGALEVPLGAMFAGQHKEFIVRVRMQAPAEGSHPVASVRFLFQDPAEQNLERVQEAVARFDVVNDPTLAAGRKNEKAQNVFAMIDASKFTERASVAINSDDFDAADRELAEAEKKLRSQAAAATTAKDKARLEASASQVSQTRAGAAKAAKAPPAARPAAKRDSALKANEAAMDLQGF